MAIDRRVVWISHKDGDRCVRCGREIDAGTFLLIDREQGIRCLTCGELDDLIFVSAGDPALTRRALALSTRSAIVVKFSRRRKRHERQGILVEEPAYEQALRACQADAARRDTERVKRVARAEAADLQYVARFAAKVRELYPGCPPQEAAAIAEHACKKYSGRVGRSGAAKALDPRTIMLAMRARLRHRYTGYDDLLAQGFEPVEARAEVADLIEEVLERWARACGGHDRARSTELRH